MAQVEELKDVFSAAFGVAQDCNFDAIAYGQTEGWDSVAHMALMAAIELKFDIMLDTDDVIAISSYPEAKRILNKYGLVFD